MITVIAPTHLIIGKNKKKKYALNLNQFRNNHYIVNNKLKKEFELIVSKQLKEYRFSKFKKIEIDFVLYKASKRKIDRSNVLSIIEKFFCDALVSLQIIEDDNDDFIESTHYYSGYDKNDPRVEIFIKVLGNT